MTMGLFGKNTKRDPFVRVIDLAADKLEPNSRYLFVFNKRQINVRDALSMGATLKQNSIKSTVVLVDGDVRTAVRAYSIPEDEISIIDEDEPIAPEPITLEPQFIEN